MFRARSVAVAGLAAVVAAAAFFGRGLFPDRPYEPPPYQALPPRHNPAKGPSLLLVTLDTTRADRLGCYGNDLIRTPRLDAFAASGVRFENAFCPVPETDPSHATLLTGLPPDQHGMLKNGWDLAAELPRLPGVLRTIGYTTYGATSVEHLGEKTGFHVGFDWFDCKFRGHQRDGRDTLRLVKTWLDDVASRPYFLWVHWFDAHRDQGSKPPRYQPPADRMPDAAREKLYESRGLPAEVARYDAQIEYLDALFGGLLDELGRRGALANTVVAVIADHGETLHELVERDGYGGYQYTHGDYLFDHQARIPFLLAGPGIPTGRVVHEQVRSVDFFPTALEAIGATVPDGLEGKSLLPLARGESEAERPVLLLAGAQPKYKKTHDVALRRSGTKLVVTREGGEEWFDLPADPEEARALKPPSEAVPMREELGRFKDRIARVKEQPVNPALIASLKALGYIQNDAGSKR